MIKSNVLQAKLKVSQPNDPYEREADQVADQVMKMPVLSDMVMTVGTKKDGVNINHECAPCETKKKEEKEERQLEIRPKPSLSTESNFKASDEIANEINHIHSNIGSSLDASTKGFMESRFGYDFSKVKIHTDETATRTSNSVNALAYTIGNDIVFGEGHYQPNKAEGRKLLAHELTHVIQQEQVGNNISGYVPMVAQIRYHSNVVRRQPRPQMHDPKHDVKHSSIKESMRDGGEIKIDRSLDLYTGPIELRPGSVGWLTYQRQVWIKTPEGHEATLLVIGSLHLYPPFNPLAGVEDALRESGKLLNLRWNVQVKYATKDLPDLSGWHYPPDGNQHIRGNNQTLIDLADDKAALFARFSLTRQRQYETLSAYIKESYLNEIPRQIKIEEERRKAARERPSPEEEMDVEAVAEVVVDLATDFIPGISNVKDAIIALTGVNPVTGEKVGWFGRVFSALFAIPGIGNLLKYGVKGVGKALVWLGRRLGPLIVAAGAWSLSKAKKIWDWIVERLGRKRPALPPSQRQLPPASSIPEKIPEGKSSKTIEETVRIGKVFNESPKKMFELKKYKDEGFVEKGMTADKKGYILENPTTRDKIIIELRQPTDMPWFNPKWGRNRLEKEIRKRGFKIDPKPLTDAPGKIYTNPTTGERLRIMDKPSQIHWYNDDIEKHLNDFYFRYQPGPGRSWGPHVTIPNN
jgi:hypothetical protein